MKQPRLPARIEGSATETQKEATQRHRRNRQAFAMYRSLMSVRCAECGHVRGHVTHNTEVEDQLEGPDYYADCEQHDFVEPAEGAGGAA